MKHAKLKTVLVNFLKEYAKKYRESIDKFVEPDWSIMNNITVSVEGYNIIVEIPEYYKYIAAGRKPGSTPPPSDAILDWIKVKRIIPRVYKGGKPPTQEQLAFVIARSIGKKGIPARPFLKQAEEATPFDLDELTKELAEVVIKNLN